MAAATFLSFAMSAPAAACMLPSILYFEPGSNAIDARSEEVVQTLVSWIQRNPGVEEIRLTGHTDRTGTIAGRAAISLARAEAVRDRFVSYGVPAGLIVVDAIGDARPAVETPDGAPEPDNRRVEVIFTLSKAGHEALTRRPPAPIGALPTC
jgi:outer membrane protein OmpA-like peptidoglycan-associated protein